MDIVANSLSLVRDTTRRERARGRLYVLCQLGGWGSFMLIQLTVQLTYSHVISATESARSAADLACAQVILVTTGLLLTHGFRPMMRRWGWKHMSWRMLIPRIAVLSLTASFFWTAAVSGYLHGILREPWPLEWPWMLLMACSWLNGSLLFGAWLGCYYFYHLTESLSRSEVERFAMMSSVKEAELRALKSQVNPHFIFNSLNSLRALIGEDPQRARHAVTQLANLLRYSLQSGQQETVPFEDELRIVKDYLALEQVRHEERLRVRLDIDPDTLALPVPPMLLQTLVENAIKYGISALPQGGEIAISAHREGGMLRVCVVNPGDLGTGEGASTGLGLRNAGERLRLIFGSGASIRLRSAGAAEVIAEALIPLATAPA
jgi:hypothetical protein